MGNVSNANCILTDMILSESFPINEFCSEFADSKLGTLFAMTRQMLICILKVQGEKVKKWKFKSSYANDFAFILKIRWTPQIYKVSGLTSEKTAARLKLGKRSLQHQGVHLASPSS